jgi:hypothetical protein
MVAICVMFRAELLKGNFFFMPLIVSVADPDHFLRIRKRPLTISDPAAYTLRRYVVFAYCPK